MFRDGILLPNFRAEIAGNYDAAWNTSRIGTFEFTDVGAIVAKTHLQNFLVGPRYFFNSAKVDRKHQVFPFAELQFGVTHLHQSVQEGTAIAATNKDSA